jgi:tetratricopeptide (TPR) repeat protein
MFFGSERLKTEQYADAEKQFTLAWHYFPVQAETLQKRGQCARLLGQVYEKQEKYQDAIYWYQQAVTLDPDDLANKNVYRALATHYVSLEKRPEAIHAYEKLLTFPSDTTTQIGYLYHLSALCIEEKDYERALHYVQKWSNLASDDPIVQNFMSKLHLRTGAEDEAVATMETVMVLNPNDFETLDNLSELYNRRGETQKAFDAYMRLHKHAPQNYLYLEHLKRLGKQLQKPKSFQIEILRNMYALNPEDLSVVIALSEFTGDRLWVQKGLQLDPQNGRLLILQGDFYYNNWLTSHAAADSSNAMNFYQAALKDPQWADDARHMIATINPPKTEEEKIAEAFWQHKKKEEAVQEGKK